MTATKGKTAVHLASPRSHQPSSSLSTRATANTTSDAAATAIVGQADRPVQSKMSAPESLRHLDRWLLWKYWANPKTGKETKVPISPKSFRKMDGTTVSKGFSFAFATAALERNPEKADGIGFILGEGIGGIDVDDCIDEHGKLSEFGERIRKRFESSYAEVSPSGTGFKLWVIIGDDAELNKIGINTGTIEMYGSARYFTVTGNLMPGHPQTLAHMPEAFAKTYSEARQGTRTARVEQSKDHSARALLKSNIPLETVEKALRKLDPDCTNDAWIRYGFALELDHGEDGYRVWDEWSASSAIEGNYPGPEETGKHWARFKQKNDELNANSDPSTCRTILYDAGVPIPKEARSSLANFTLISAEEMMAQYSDDEEITVLGAVCLIGVTMLSGLGGSGKSTVCATLAAHVTNGQPCPPWETPDTQREPAHVLWLSTEEDMRLVLRRHRALGGDMKRLWAPKLQVKVGNDGVRRATHFNLLTDLQDLMEEALAAGKPIKLVVCDAMPAMVQWGNQGGANSDAEVKLLMLEMNELMRAHNACLLGIAHFNKNTDKPDEYRTAGSQAWRDSPRLSFIVSKPGVMYVNKHNDLKDVGVMFDQEVVEVLREIRAVMADGKPMQVTARRANFGPHLIDKDVLLASLKAPKLPDDVEAPPPKPPRIEHMVAIVAEYMDVMADKVPVNELMAQIAARHGSQPNGVERAEIRKRLSLHPYREGSVHFWRISQ